MLGHWPIKLALLSPMMPFLKDAELLLLADCAAAAYPNLHHRFLGGRAVALACPKLDDPEAHVEKLALLLQQAGIRSIAIVHMEVPCCHGLEAVAREAIRRSGARLPVRRLIVSRTGQIMADENLDVPAREAPE